VSPSVRRTCWGRRHPASQTGLTLLEVLVSASILAIILSLLYGAYHAQMTTTDEIEDVARINQIVRVVFERMTKDLESAVIRFPNIATAGLLGMESEDRVEDGLPADRIHFTSLSHLEAGDSKHHTDLCEIGYMLEPDPEGPGFRLIRMDDPTPDGDMNSGGPMIELARSIGGLDFVFEDDAGNISNQWNAAELNQGEKAPSIISISITLLDRSGTGHRFTTRVRLPMIEGMEDEKRPLS
jgi:prepilin-type N-terminal cleavage/methylation domain-containing protein